MNPLMIAIELAVALLPSRLKIPIYRLFFGYKIGRGVRIGLSPLIGVRRLSIGDGTRIGWFNVFYRVEHLAIGRHVNVGFLNCFRGGQSIRIGDYTSILRMNTLNAIIDGDFVSAIEPRLEIGAGSVITTGHWLDFSAGIQLGDHVILGGRNSSLWTHNRQIGKPILLASHIYLGSEVRLAPGASVAPFCVVALGSVLSGRFDRPRCLIGGNPARTVRKLRETDLFLVTRKTRRDIPDQFEIEFLPDDLREVASLSNGRSVYAAWTQTDPVVSADTTKAAAASTAPARTAGEVA